MICRLSGGSRPQRRLLAMMFVILAAANLFVMALSGYSLYQSRQHHEARASAFTQNVAEAVDASVSRSVEKIDLALKAVASDLELQLARGGIDRATTEAMLAKTRGWLPEVDTFRVSNAEGRVVFGQGLNPADPPSWADRDFFVHLREHPEAGLWISRPHVGRVSKRMIIGFNRRYNYPDGRFGGIVSAPVALEQFYGLLSHFNVGPMGTVILRDADLGLIARYPAIADSPAGMIGANAVSQELRDLVDAGVASATYHARRTADGVERTNTFRRVGGANMLVIAGIGKDDYLADWYGEARRTAAWVLGFVLLSGLTGCLLARLLRRIARESQRNALFLHHGSDGIHILDERGNLIQASEHFCAMLGYHRDELIGMNVESWEARWSPEALANELLPALLRQDKATTLETLHRRKDGEVIEVELNVVGFDLDGSRCLFASSRDIGEKKRQEQALRESEERYRLLLSNSPVGILHYNPDLKVTYANERFETIMHVPKGYMTEFDCNRLDDKVVVDPMRRALSGENAGYEGPYTTSYGHVELWISMACAPVFDAAGRIIGGIVIVEDITERKRIEAAERRQREGLARLNEVASLSHLPLGERLRQALAIGTGHLGLEFGIVSHVTGGSYGIVAQVSPPGTLADGQCFDLGATYCDITLGQKDVVAISEMGASSYVGHPCYQAFRLEAYIGAPIYVGGEVYGTVNFSSPRPYHRPFDDGDTEFVSLLARWVGSAIERDQARRSLVESEARLQAIIDNEPECVKVVAADGKLVQMNRAGLAMLEVGSVDEVNSRGLGAFIVPEHRLAFKELNRRVFGGETASLEFMIVAGHGTQRWLDTHAAPLHDAGGQVTALLGVTRDITARKLAESQLRLAASVFTHAHEGIIICDADQSIIDVNPTFVEITGYGRSEIIGQTPKVLKSGRQSPEFYREMWRAIDCDGHWEGEIWNRRKDGSLYAERLTISSLRDDDGRVSHYIGTFSDISAFKEHQAQLEYLAHYDALTQLPNRTLLSDRMAQGLAQTKRAGTLMAVCYLDLDGFKEINDRYGHDAGDALLIEVARRLRETLRGVDTIARLGGDEFVLLLVGINTVDECDRAATRVLRAIAAPVRIGEQECSVSGSIGIALFPHDDSDPDTLLRHADQAMYAAKQAGKNRYQLYDASKDQQERSRSEALERIRQALAAGEFELHYQPIVDMLRGNVLAFEGLVRWRHPERGLLLPEEFLPLLEGSELDIELGRWVLSEGVRQLTAWRAQGLPQNISLNVSAAHLLAPDFVDEVVGLLDAHPSLEPHALEIEVMETAATRDLEAAIEVFRRCREAGVDIALDDFGTGYSSLSYFRRLPVDTLKIDQIFVQSVMGSSEDFAIVDSVISLTRAFNRKMVAEGVETVEIGMLLLSMGCHVGQGYGIARPMPAAAVPAWVAGFVPDPSWSFPATSFTHDDLPLFMAELDHRAWVRQLEEWLAAGGADPVPPPEVDHCRFGRWYGGEGQRHYGRFDSFVALGETHRAVHRLAHELVDLRLAGQAEDARARIGELREWRDRLIDGLAALQAEVVVEKM